MSWKDNLQDATWRGVRFDVLRASDECERDVARHGYPYLDGEDFEDLGASAWHFSLTAAFWGDDYDTRLKAFTDVLDVAGYGELIHPIYGSIAKAQLLKYRITHDADDVDYCRVELHFAEATPGNPFFVKQTASQQAQSISASSATAQSGGFAAFASKISSIANTIQGGIARVAALRNVITYTMASIQGQVQGVVASALDVIAFPLTFTSNVTSFFDAMASTPSFAVGSIMSDWSSLTGKLNNAVTLPSGINSGTAVVSSSIGPVSVGVPSALATAGGQVTSGSPIVVGVPGTTGAPVAPTSITAAGASPDDVALVTAAVQLAATLQIATAASNILADESTQPTLSPPDLEQIVNDTRTSINATIAQYRDLFDVVTSRPITEALKDIALAIQTAAIAVIDQQPALTTRTVNTPGNLTLIAFWWYGDYTRAGELARLNPSIRNPNFVLPGTVLNAYAS